MSSPPYDHNPHFVDHDFETSDTLWQSLSLPIEDHNPVDSFNCQWPFFQESNTSSHAADYTKILGELDSNLLVGEELSALSLSSFNEETLDNILHYHEDSNYPFGERTVGDLDPSMPLEQQKFSLANDGEIIESTVLNDCQNNSISIPSNKDDLKSCEMGSCEQENTSLDKSNSGRRKRVIKKKEIKHRFRRLLSEKMIVQPNAEEGSTSKKQNHNAKEKVRRMELNASYLALGSLLPNSTRSKKRWTAPVIIDKVLEYIPELQSEIEKLTLKKNSIVSKIKSKQAIQQNASVQLQPPTVSVHEVKQGELIIQICMQTNQDNGISILMKNLEAEGMVISSASSIGVCDDIISYHVHVQMNGNPLAADYLALKQKL